MMPNQVQSRELMIRKNTVGEIMGRMIRVVRRTAPVPSIVAASFAMMLLSFGFEKKYVNYD